MFDETPANENVSLSSLMANPEREKANDALAKTLLALEAEGVSHAMLAELLFEFLMIEMEPDDPVTSEKAVIWFAQLTRFRDALQSKINRIENLYKDAQG